MSDESWKSHLVGLVLLDPEDDDVEYSKERGWYRKSWYEEAP